MRVLVSGFLGASVVASLAAPVVPLVTALDPDLANAFDLPLESSLDFPLEFVKTMKFSSASGTCSVVDGFLPLPDGGPFFTILSMSFFSSL
jgi:hypothetical protein